MNFEAHFGAELARLKEDGSYRHFANLERMAGQFPSAILREGDQTKVVTVWCSNDYLAMGEHPEVIRAMKKAIDACGAGAGGTRNIAGTNVYHVRLERELAQLHGKEAALLLTSGFNANETALSTLQRHLPGCVVFSDALNHASMIDGIRHGGGDKHIFRHNDAAHLEELLAAEPSDCPKIIALESVYSMEAERAPLCEVVELGRRYEALIYLDETHAVGLYGRTGGGLAEELGVQSDVHLIQGTLGKAFGVQGGYVAGAAPLIDAIRSFGRGLIFTTAPPPAVAAAALRSVQIVRESPELRTAHQERARQLKAKLSEVDIPMMRSDTHIVPVMVGDATMCRCVSRHLLDVHGIYVQPINHPTVARGTERLRLTPTPMHTADHMDELVEALVETWSALELRHARA